MKMLVSKMTLTKPLSPSPLAAAAIGESLTGFVPLPRHATAATLDPYQLSDWEGDNINFIDVYYLASLPSLLVFTLLFRT